MSPLSDYPSTHSCKHLPAQGQALGLEESVNQNLYQKLQHTERSPLNLVKMPCLPTFIQATPHLNYFSSLENPDPPPFPLGKLTVASYTLSIQQ